MMELPSGPLLVERPSPDAVGGALDYRELITIHKRSPRIALLLSTCVPRKRPQARLYSLGTAPDE